MGIRFTTSAGKHLVSKESVLAAMESQGDPLVVTAENGDVQLWWFGDDGTQEIEIIAVEIPAGLLVIHAMPLNYRKPTRRRGMR